MIKIPLKDQSAFPWADQGEPMDQGLTKREYFAAMAMQALRAGAYKDPTVFVPETVARFALEDAAALLAELEKERT